MALDPQDKKRGAQAYVVDNPGYTLAGWYTDRQPRVDEQGRPLDEYGVRLGDTELYEKYKVMQLFPEDTVICLRILSEVGASKGKNREVYANAEQTLRAIFAYS